MLALVRGTIGWSVLAEKRGGRGPSEKEHSHAVQASVIARSGREAVSIHTVSVRSALVLHLTMAKSQQGRRALLGSGPGAGPGGG
jgi:hypothetical protein